MSKETARRGWLKEKRLAANQTQAEVAKAVGMSQSGYANIENGVSGASIKVAKAIGRVLGFDWVCFFEDEKKENGICTIT